jgi:hypothetical protein
VPRVAVGLLIAGLALLAPLFPAAGGPGRLQVIDDGETTRADRVVHDVRHVALEIVDDTLEVTLQFRRAFPEMMFEAADIHFDCDDDAATGIDGADLRIRSSVGSRFHGNAWKPDAGGVPPPLDQRRCGVAKVHSYRAGASTEERRLWLWGPALPAPEIGEGKLVQRIPLKLLREEGLRYNHHVPLWIEVEGSCSESPIPLVHVVTDDGVGIRADARPEDWSGGTRADDETGEMHPDASALDVARVQVDHGPAELLVGVWLFRPGFGAAAASDLDVDDRDRITVSVEPLGGEYLGYRQYVLHARNPQVDAADWSAVHRDRFVEFSIERPPAQAAFRVIVWTDAVRIDRIPDTESFRLDTRAK